MKLDRFVDTPSKRRYAILLVTACLLLIGAVQNLKLGLLLHPVERYEELFKLLSSGTLYDSYLSRCSYDVIAQATITPWVIIKAMIESLHFFEILLLLVTIFFLTVNYKSGKSQRWLYAGLVSFGVLILLCAWCVGQGLFADSLAMVIDQLHVISTLLIFQSFFQIVMCLCAIYSCVMGEYRYAMMERVEYDEEG